MTRHRPRLAPSEKSSTVRRVTSRRSNFDCVRSVHMATRRTLTIRTMQNVIRTQFLFFFFHFARSFSTEIPHCLLCSTLLLSSVSTRGRPANYHFSSLRFIPPSLPPPGPRHQKLDHLGQGLLPATCARPSESDIFQNATRGNVPLPPRFRDHRVNAGRPFVIRRANR